LARHQHFVQQTVSLEELATNGSKLAQLVRGRTQSILQEFEQPFVDVRWAVDVMEKAPLALQGQFIELQVLLTLHPQHPTTGVCPSLRAVPRPVFFGGVGRASVEASGAHNNTPSITKMRGNKR
jgi:hypothetical protein